MLKNFIFLAIMLGLSSAHAAHYGTAGCGLGAAVFKDKPGMIQVVASLLNGIGSQTSGLTSGTSGCREHQGAGASIQYIETNKLALQEDAARGNGETLDGLVTLLNCQDSNVVKSSVKKNYDSIFSKKDSNEILGAIISIDAVKSSCGIKG